MILPLIHLRSGAVPHRHLPAQILHEAHRLHVHLIRARASFRWLCWRASCNLVILNYVTPEKTLSASKPDVVSAARFGLEGSPEGTSHQTQRRLKRTWLRT
jgi:hypothetical protein